MLDNEPDRFVAGIPSSIVGDWLGHSCSCRAAVAGLKPFSGAVARSPVGLPSQSSRGQFTDRGRRGDYGLACGDWRYGGRRCVESRLMEASR